MSQRYVKAYPKEFRAQVVQVFLAGGRRLREVAEEFEVSQDSLRRWVKQAQIDSGQRKDGLTTAERKELRELRRELRRVRMEREILAKAAAWFARETGSMPSGSSSSQEGTRVSIRQP